MELAIIGFVAAIALGAWLRVATKPDPFRSAAGSLGLDHSRTVPDMLPRLSGTINGLPVRVDAPDGKATQIRYRIFYPDLGLALRLERETTISRTLGALGSGDREVGDKTFDAKFRVNTSRPDALQKLLTPELRSQLVELVDTYPAVIVGDGEITLVVDDDSPTVMTLVNTVNDLVIVGAILNANRPPPLEKPAPRARPVREAPSEAPPPASPSDAEPTTESPRGDAPPPPQPEPEPEPPAPPPVPVAPPSGLPDGFYDDVFGENRLSFEADDTFEQEIRGSEVRLSGAVKQSSPYEDKSDLAPSTGTKAVVTVAKIDNDLYGKTDIDAVVHLHGRLDLDRGQQITFTGTLDGVDAFMRNLFVTDARIV
ncbi:MAG: hypothetical protein QNJ75_13010 [Acidimicrobiia bacterium]|nr:hypothetical protein [Acidimicrobiia bacterium]